MAEEGCGVLVFAKAGGRRACARTCANMFRQMTETLRGRRSAGHGPPQRPRKAVNPSANLREPTTQLWCPGMHKNRGTDKTEAEILVAKHFVHTK